MRKAHLSGAIWSDRPVLCLILVVVPQIYICVLELIKLDPQSQYYFLKGNTFLQKRTPSSSTVANGL